MAMLTLPSAVFIYNDQKLGCPDMDLLDATRQDPTWERSEHIDRGCARCWVPIPLSGVAPPFGLCASC